MTRKLVSALSLAALALAACSDAPTSLDSSVAPVVAPPSKHTAGDDPTEDALYGNHNNIAPVNVSATKADNTPLDAGNVAPLGTAVKLTWGAPNSVPAGYSLQRFRYTLTGDAAAGLTPISGTVGLTGSGTPVLAFTTPTTLKAGTYTFSVFTDADGPKHNGRQGNENHASLRVSVTFYIQAAPSGPKPNVISFAFPASFAKAYGDGSFLISDVDDIVAEASSGLDLSYASTTPATCAIAGGSTEEIVIRGAGTCTIEASQAGDDDYVAATPRSSSFTIRPATIAINANDAATTYGTAPTLGYTLSGFAYDESEAGLRSATPPALSGNAVCSVASGTPSGAGAHGDAISCTIGTLDATNYTFVVGAAGDLTISKAPLTVTADDESKTYDGEAFTAFSVTYDGFVNGETTSALGGTLGFGGSAVGAKNAGTYTITPGGLTAANYDIAFVDGTLTIDKAPLTITAGDKSMYFGDPLPTFTASYSGFVNGETAAVLAGALTFEVIASVAGQPLAVGAHLIRPAGVSAANYDIEFVDGKLTVLAWRLAGFYQPVDMGGVLNSVKAGSTVPLKFEIFKGTEELTATTAIKSFTHGLVACAGGAEDAVEITTTGGTSLRYDALAGQFVQNWQTPKSPGQCYKVVMTTLDGSRLDALFRLK